MFSIYDCYLAWTKPVGATVPHRDSAIPVLTCYEAGRGITALVFKLNCLQHSTNMRSNPSQMLHPVPREDVRSVCNGKTIGRLRKTCTMYRRRPRREPLQFSA